MCSLGMGLGRSADPGALARTRAAVGASLRTRCDELEQAALSKARTVSDDPQSRQAEYAAGLRRAIGAALDSALEVLEGRKAEQAAIPATLLVQARLAARAGVGLDVVIRRYAAGHALLDDAIAAELAAGGSSTAGDLRRLLREQAVLFDRAVEAVSEEYRAEAGRQRAPMRRQTLLVHRHLAGELVDPAELPYDFGAWHIGAVASGSGAEPVLSSLAAKLDRRLLLVEGSDDTAWAWFGGSRRIGSEQVERAASSLWPDSGYLTIGEPERGLAGWRLTHRQARALAPLALRGQRRVLRYAGHGLLASMAQDDLLDKSLRQIYLAPLAKERDEGVELRRTLRAYFAGQRNASSAAATLGVSRKTVATRLERVEDRIGRPFASCSFEVEAALALDGLPDLGSSLSQQ